MKNPKLMLLINVLGLVLVLAVAAFMIKEQRDITSALSQKTIDQLKADINSINDIAGMKQVTMKICGNQLLLGTTYLNRIRSDIVLLVVVSFLFLVNLAVYYGNKKTCCTE